VVDLFEADAGAGEVWSADESGGLLELRPGHGIRVSGTPQRGAQLAKAIELVQLSRESGYDRAELLDIIQQLP